MAKSGRQKSMTPAHELESRLVDSAQRYELIFQATNDVIYEFDIVSGVITWNDAFYEKFGYPKKDNASPFGWWLGNIHPDDAQRLKKEYSEWFKSGQSIWEAEYRYRKHDGHYVYIRDRGLLQRGSSGEPVRVIGSLLDITADKQLDRAKDEFISLVSHQLRTPLTIIRLYSEMLTGNIFGPLGGEQKKQVKKITAASTKLISLIGDILDLSKLEMGVLSSHPEPTDVNRLIMSYIDEFHPRALSKGIDIRLETDESIKEVNLDVMIFSRIIHNLLANAIRYSQPSGGKITVSFHKNKDGFLLSVKDKGIGIPKSAQRYVFSRFYRVGNTVNISEHGTGLGLYLVKTMAETAGCKIWFKSIAGRGTVFYLQIPATGMRAT